jgi:hypothetical protein
MFLGALLLGPDEQEIENQDDQADLQNKAHHPTASGRIRRKQQRRQFANWHRSLLRAEKRSGNPGIAYSGFKVLSSTRKAL